MVRFDEIESPAHCHYRLAGYKGNDDDYGCGYWRQYAGARNTPCLSEDTFPKECPLLDTSDSELSITNEVTGKTIPVKKRSGKYDKDKKIVGLWSDNSKLGPARKYRKNPLIITASRILERIEIETLEGVMVGEPGAWLITGVAGEKYPCDDAIFKATYSPQGSYKCEMCRNKDTEACTGETTLMYPICNFSWCEDELHC